MELKYTCVLILGNFGRGGYRSSTSYDRSSGRW